MDTKALESRLKHQAEFKFLKSRFGNHIFVVNDSSLFDFQINELNFESIEQITNSFPFDPSNHIDDQISLPNPQSISLNVSSSCNLSCSYCYASRGSFSGAQNSIMTKEIAFEAIAKLVDGATSSSPITIGFIGGEPFLNRKLIHDCVDFCKLETLESGKDIRFSVTTNGTLLTAQDISMFQENNFAITISIDGDNSLQSMMRPSANKKKPYDIEDIRKNISPLLVKPGKSKLAARATISNNCLDIVKIFKDILALGFPEVGISPLRGNSDSALRASDWYEYLNSLKSVSIQELERAKNDLPIRFSNFAIALKQIHKGFKSPYPCGAGGGYFSVSSKGDWYTCHRSIGDPRYIVGNSKMIDKKSREIFLKKNHIHNQTDCKQCWAKYLCSGGCHQEKEFRSLASCDFIREWLEFCLISYIELTSTNLDYFKESI